MAGSEERSGNVNGVVAGTGAVLSGMLDRLGLGVGIGVDPPASFKVGKFGTGAAGSVRVGMLERFGSGNVCG